ncbi:hypothetical protein NTHI1209_00837 [Haemophilus influenzae]|uniref:Uncharacterized protein n=1 Tax=Haemophilus influenzae TaxID=727 RepID=A0A158SWI9_HAEIF|nr:hypothetical protein NTHI1209_00837 [Haemophilus influenzae]
MGGVKIPLKKGCKCSPIFFDYFTSLNKISLGITEPCQ